MLTCLNDIKHGFYINLESRKDRKEHVETQLESIGIKDVVKRFNAIRLPNGALGCSFSHLKCIETARENKWEHVLIVEDDIHFLDFSLFVQQINQFFNNKKNEFDVVLLAGNNMPPYKKIDDTCVQVSQCQTTTGYIVLSHYFDIIIENMREGIKNLIKEPSNHGLYAIDKFWFRLQQQNKWYLIIPLTVTQREGDYSDIEGRPSNYTRSMTDLNKEWLIYNRYRSMNKINFSV
jgi:GR25 family glycosyltransferase involved in LPS biosynthesis